MGSGSGLSISADERLAILTNFSRSGTNDTRVLANEDKPHGRIKRLERVSTLKLAIREEGGLALLTMKIENRT
jgi:hypothetical protein